MSRFVFSLYLSQCGIGYNPLNMYANISRMAEPSSSSQRCVYGQQRFWRDDTNSNEVLSISQLTHAVSKDGSRVSNTHFREYSSTHLTDHPSVNLVSTTSISVSGNVGKAQIGDTVLPDAMSTDDLNTAAAMRQLHGLYENLASRNLF